MSRLIALSYRTPMLDLLKNKRPNGFRIAVRNDT